MSTDEQYSGPRERFIKKLNDYLNLFLAQNKNGGVRTSKTKIAEKIMLCRRETFYRWMNGDSPMPRDALERLCKHISLSHEQQNELLWLGGYIDEPVSSRRVEDATPAPSDPKLASLVQIETTKPLPITIINPQDQSAHIQPRSSNAPPLPSLMLGRGKDVEAVKARLGLGLTQGGMIQVLTAMKGWPGVGKTTLASALAYDEDIAQQFPDGVLWASLGQQPNVARELAAWGRLLGIPDLHQAATIDEMSARLRGVLRSQRRLLIVDDAWQAKDILPFKVGGTGCALLITTRRTEVAEDIAPTAQDIYTLGVLSPADALDLLRLLAPTVVAANEQACQDLLQDIENLPLAIQVAGRLLHVEASRGFGVQELLVEIRAGAKLIEAKPPADRSEIAQDTTPTIAALLKKSTDLLDKETLECFAYLGAFAAKPATFDADAMKAIWQVDDAKPTIRKLIDHGLLEVVVQNSDVDAWLRRGANRPAPSLTPQDPSDGSPVEVRRYWLHAILVAHANSFLTEEDGFVISG